MRPQEKGGPAGEAYWKRVDELIRLAIEEDLPAGDITTAAVVEDGMEASAVILGKEQLVVSGLEIAARVFSAVGGGLDWTEESRDGELVEPGRVLARVTGRAASILAGERTALNFLQHLSGIATKTRRMVAEVSDLPTALLDTRKTLPGWRLLEKAAVVDGGGRNHRFSLSDSVLIKDNHLRLGGGVAAAVGKARAKLPPGTAIEVETSSLDEVREALEAGADVILVDNATPGLLADALHIVDGRRPVEASGGVDESNLRAMAGTGVDMISVGALTHSAAAVDISLELV